MLQPEVHWLEGITYVRFSCHAEGTDCETRSADDYPILRTLCLSSASPRFPIKQSGGAAIVQLYIFLGSGQFCDIIWTSTERGCGVDQSLL
jgi:hypothetical protein